MIEKKIKWIAILGLAILLIHIGKFECHAQFSIGLKGGYNFSQVSFEPNINQSFQTGFTGGIVLRNSYKPNVGLIAEINYSQKGWIERFPSTEFLPVRNAFFRYDYVEMPIMTHIYLGGDFAKVFINLGPHISYLLSQSSSNNLLEGDSISYDFTAENTRSIEYGLTLGGGLRLNLGKAGDLHLEFRGALGMNDIFDREQPNTPIGSQNLAMGAQVTYFINISGSDPTEKAKPPKNKPDEK